jgi:LmbE family N-acetylglucosaminyl deacetylase
MIKDYIKRTILFLLIVFTLLFSTIFIKYNYFEKKYIKNELSKIDLKKYNNLMIVAHPDDETLWGSSELINKNYVVVCVTCKTNPVRVKEFQNVMNATNDRYLMLGYPDKIFLTRSDWKFSYKYIKRDLKYIEKANDWQIIVTHNKAGEYGHNHHKMVHKLVWDTADKNKVYVFGKYCSKKSLDSGNCVLDYNLPDYELNEKIKLLKYYKSQKHVVKEFKHMVSHEKIEKASK